MSHYKLAAGRDPLPFIEAVETFSNKGGMLPEQLWDANDLPEGKMKRRGPTGSQVGWHLVPYSYFCGKRDGKKIFRWGLLRQFQSGSGMNKSHWLLITTMDQGARRCLPGRERRP